MDTESKIFELLINTGGSVVSVCIFIIYIAIRDNKYSCLLEKVSIALTEITNRLREHNDDHKDIKGNLEKIKEIIISK